MKLAAKQAWSEISNVRYVKSCQHFVLFLTYPVAIILSFVTETLLHGTWFSFLKSFVLYPVCFPFTYETCFILKTCSNSVMAPVKH